MQSSVDERNGPVVDVPLHELQLPAALSEYEVVGHGFVVFEEIVLYDVCLVAKAEDKVLMAEVGIVLHDMPQHRPRPNRYHGLRHVFGVTPQSHSCAAAKQNDFHNSP